MAPPRRTEEEQEHNHDAVSLSYVDLEYHEEDAAVGFRLIYPADDESTAAATAKPPSSSSSLFAPRWSDAHPVYARGYTAVAFFGAAASLKLRALKAAFTALVWLVSAASPLPLLRGRPLVAAEDASSSSSSSSRRRRLPVVVFSHGASSNRHTYTYLACEIARRVPCAVACIEHCDGTAAVARVPAAGGGGDGSSNSNNNNNNNNKWLYYQGLGKGEALESKCGVRVSEVRLAVRALRALDGRQEGGRLQRLGGAAGAAGAAAAAANDDPVLASFAGRLDLDARLAVAGHSCGGATAAAAAAVGPTCPDLGAVSAACAIDPWWALLPSAEPPLAAADEGGGGNGGGNSSSPPTAPLLVLGSHAWQTPRLPDGGMMCGGERQRRVFEAWARGGGSSSKGPGAILAVPRGSGHHSFSDVALLLERSWLLRGLRGLVGASQPELPSAEAIEMSGWAVARFLKDRWAAAVEEEGGGGGGGNGAASRPRPVSARELDAYRAYFGERAAILEVKV